MTAAPFPLVAAGRDAAATLAAAHARCFDAPWDAGTFDAVLAIPGTSALTARPPEGPPAGLAVFRLTVDEGELLTLAVVPEHRGAGLGRRLLDGVLATAVAGGARRMVLEVATDNTAARRLYAAAGFGEAGRRRAYYPRPGDRPADALILARTLPPDG